MPSPPRLDLRPGIAEPVVLLISRREVEQADLPSVLSRLKVFLATREDAWLYRGQMTLVVDGYNHDPRELVDIPEVRTLLRRLEAEWPYWAFFLNQLDHTINLWAACLCGDVFPGGGQVQIDVQKLRELLIQGFVGMNELFMKHDFPEKDLFIQSEGLARMIQEIGPVG